MVGPPLERPIDGLYDHLRLSEQADLVLERVFLLVRQGDHELGVVCEGVVSVARLAPRYLHRDISDNDRVWLVQALVKVVLVEATQSPYQLGVGELRVDDRFGVLVAVLSADWSRGGGLD